MKKLVLILLLQFAMVSAFAQHFETEVFLQNTVMGMQQGFGLYIKNAKGLGLGFLQQSNRWGASESYDIGYSFIGIGARFPLEQCGKLTLELTPKVGFVNDRFLVVLPEITTKYQVIRNLRLGLGAGLRARKSALAITLSYQPF